MRAREVVSDDVANFAQMELEALRRLVSSNAEPLRLVRAGLAQRCMMPLEAALTNSAGMLPGLAEMKRLGHLLTAEARLRELEGRPAEAARVYVEVIRFGNEMSRGGFLITRLVGVACESMGSHGLAKLLPKLGAKDCRLLVHALEQVDAERVTWADVMRAERQYARYQLRNRFNPFLHAVGWWQSRRAISRGEARLKEVVAQERLLATEMALRCHLADRGVMPQVLSELLTNYITNLPRDPFNGAALVYRAQSGTNWLLYSVGPDRVDDGGKTFGVGTGKGDVILH